VELIVDAANRQIGDVILPQTGVAVYDGEIMRIEGPGIEASPTFERQGVQGWEVRIGDRPAASALVTFADGSGAAVAILRDYGLHLTLSPGGIVDLRYNPTEASYLFHDYLEAIGQSTGSAGDLALLRGLAAEAKRLGVLGFAGTFEERSAAANSFANQIRMGKGVDPTLGIYAAYAYALGFLDEGVLSVHQILRGDLGASLFDTALLSRSLADDCANVPVVPPAPMLRQGWELLRARDVAVPPGFRKARSHLMNSLWTTFAPEGMAILGASMPDALGVNAACLAQRA
jgi:hypothetical protein